MDRSLFLALNRWAGWGYWPDFAAYAMAQFGLLFLAILMAVRWFTPGPRRRCEQQLVILACAGAVFAVGLAQGPSLLLYRARPFVSVPGAFNLLGDGPSSSFPSTHGAVAFTVATIMSRRSWGWALLTWPVALGTGVARIFGGVHYPSDIGGALLIGLAVGWCFLALRHELEPALEAVRRVPAVIWQAVRNTW